MGIYLRLACEAKTIEDSRFWLKCLKEDLKKQMDKHVKLATESASYSFAEGIHSGIFSFIEGLLS